jgi:DNA-binding beta-propeller fold protein YncE
MITGLLAVVVVVAVGSYFLVHRNLRSSTQSVASKFQNVELIKLTDNGRVGVAAISPDGHYLAYSINDGARSSLSVRQIATESAVPLLHASIGGYYGITFSPDGNYLYLHDRAEPTIYKDIYSIPTLGGTPKLVLQNADSGLQFRRTAANWHSCAAPARSKRVYGSGTAMGQRNV